MSEAGIKIKVGADVQEGLDGLKKIGAQADATSSKMASLGKPIDATSKALTNLSPGAGKAQFAMTNLSRVVQDAPFGFIAISNNIDPLLDSFSRLSEATKETGGPLKALGGALLGPAGIAFGISAITSLATVAIQKYGSLGNAMEALFSNVSNLQQANNALAKSFAEAEGKAAGEQATLSALVTIARDETLSKNARVEAIGKLNKEYDQFLPKLTLENINTQAVTAAVDKLNESLVRQAKIRGVQDLISKETATQAEALTKGLSDNVGVFDKFLNLAKAGFDPIKANLFDVTTGAKNVGEGFTQSEQRIKRFQEVLKQLLKDEAIDGTLNLEKITKVKLPKEIKVKEPITIVPSQINFKIGNLRDAVEDANENIDLPKIFGRPGKSGDMVISPEVMNRANEVRGKFDALQESAKNLSNILTNQLSGAFEGLFENILTGGKNALQVFGDAIKQVVIKLISAAITAAIFAAIIGAATGGASFGGTSKGFGSGFSAMFSQISGLPKFAKGGIVTGPTVGLIGEAGPEVIFPLDKLNDFTANANGGSTYIPVTRLSGNDILISYERTKKLNGFV